MRPESRRFLLDLLDAHGPSGAEGPAAAVWRDYCAGFAAAWSDPIGNAYAAVGPEDGPAVLLLGHIDEIGLVATHVEDSGVIRIRGVGVWDETVPVGQPARLRTRAGELLPGVIGRGPAHLLDRKARRTVQIRDLWLDVGASDADDARKLGVTVGDPVVLGGPPIELANGRLAGRALDNRAGAWVCAEALRRVAADPPVGVRVVACACVLEEVLFAGSRAATTAVDPSVAIVVDVTFAADVPGIDKARTGDVALGAGPVLSRGYGMHEGVFAELEAAAARIDVTCRLGAVQGSEGTWTDVDGALAAGVARATGLVSLPLRSMHSPVEVCDPADLDAAAAVIASFCAARTPGEDWTT